MLFSEKLLTKMLTIFFLLNIVDKLVLINNEHVLINNEHVLIFHITVLPVFIVYIMATILYNFLNRKKLIFLTNCWVRSYHVLQQSTTCSKSVDLYPILKLLLI